MKLAEFEFTGFYTDKQEDSLKAFLLKQLKGNKEIFVGIEFINQEENSLIGAVAGIKAIMETLSEIDENLKTSIAFAYGDMEADFDTKVIVKLFDEEPKIAESIIG